MKGKIYGKPKLGYYKIYQGFYWIMLSKTNIDYA